MWRQAVITKIREETEYFEETDTEEPVYEFDVTMKYLPHTEFAWGSHCAFVPEESRD